MALYVSRPQQVEAIQWTGDNFDELDAALLNKVEGEEEGNALTLLAGKDGAQGWVFVPVGHWIVHLPGDLSDIWPVDNDYFVGKYVEAETVWLRVETVTERSSDEPVND